MMLYKKRQNKDKMFLNDTEFEMIRYFCKREYRSLAEVVNYLNVDKALVNRMSRKFESLGYFEILHDQNDARKNS